MSIKDTLTPEEHEKTVHSVRARSVPQPRYTRIDFELINVGIEYHRVQWGWRIAKFIDGWTANTPPHVVEYDPPIRTPNDFKNFDIDTALDLLQQNGWTVHRWDTGARAWKGPALPVRNREQIIKLRARLTHNLVQTQGHTDRSTQVDLIYDY
jgi:hypothetical protein